MEQTHAGERHRDAVLVRGFDNIVIADGAAGCTMYSTPDLRARSTLSPNGKKASEPTVTPVFLAIHAFFSSAVSTSGFTLKVFCHTPSASTSSYSSEV